VYREVIIAARGADVYREVIIAARGGRPAGPSCGAVRVRGLHRAPALSLPRLLRLTEGSWPGSRARADEIRRRSALTGNLPGL
jgi:hypothetical protein